MILDRITSKHITNIIGLIVVLIAELWSSDSWISLSSDLVIKMLFVAIAMERFAIEDFIIGDDEGEVEGEGDGVGDSVEVTSTESIVYLYGEGGNILLEDIKYL